ncbi:MucR family transcriptional regulator (plasmid) [Aminobacter sp. BA135]|uniref:MucR family transcriptional regulator n=1 Tax=Aminobacter sp. BA135 TaxID=537596 RepID=UPI003D7A5E1A
MTEVLLKPNSQLIELTADIVAAYVSNNPVPAGELPGLIAQIHSSISTLGTPSAPVEERPTPRMPVKKTVTDGYIISLEDGKKYQTLKRHLGILGLTPEEYRSKWSLPSNYPMVAPGYSARRSELAKQLGLGRKPGDKKPLKKAGRKTKA